MKKLLTVLGLIAIVVFASLIAEPLKATNDSTAVVVTEQATTIAATAHESETASVFDGMHKFYTYTGFYNLTFGHLIMISVGLFFLFLAIKYDYEPLLLVPIGTGILIGNIPFPVAANLQIGIYESGSTLNYLYFGVLQGVYPPLIFLGIGAMTDFSSLISNIVGFSPCRSRCNWYYWRCRRPYRYFPFVEIGKRYQYFARRYNG